MIGMNRYECQPKAPLSLSSSCRMVAKIVYSVGGVGKCRDT